MLDRELLLCLHVVLSTLASIELLLTLFHFAHLGNTPFTISCKSTFILHNTIEL